MSLKVCLFLLLNIELVTGSLQSAQTSNQWFKDGVAKLKLQKARNLNHNPAKNGIFFVGDGCDITTNTAARILKGQLNNKPGEEGYLSYETFPYTGLSKTYNVDSQVADSAGTATALFSGVKTNVGTIGVTEDVQFNKCNTLNRKDNRKVYSLLKLAEDAGMSTGIVTNMRITHATPASLYANCPNRYWESDKDKNSRATDAQDCKDIAIQLVDFQGLHGDGVEVVFGAGRRNFLPNTTADPTYPTKKGRRYDGRNLINEWVAKRPDSKFVWNKTELENVDLDKTKHLLGLFAYSNMKYVRDRATDTAGEPSVVEMVEVAIKILKKNPKGFFLAVEEGLIDYGHHDNSAYIALTETIELEQAVSKATEMTDGKDTLIVVTADHGHTMSIGGYPKRGNPIFGLSVNAKNKLELAANDKMPFTTLGYTNGPSAIFGKRKNLTGVNTKDKNFLQQSLYNGDDQYESHGGQDVGIYSQGPWADLLTGVVEQNFIFHVFDHALCLSGNSDCTKPVSRGGTPVGSTASRNSFNSTVLIVLLVFVASRLFFNVNEL